VIYRLLIPLLGLVLAACNGSGGSGLSADTGNARETLALEADAPDPYDYLNGLRRSAGMTPFTQELALAVASWNHARYLDANNVLGHQELAGEPGFTGAYVPDRIVSAGYHTRWAGEVIADGQSPVHALDLLMSAIYHRLTILDPAMDRVGISFFDSPTGADFLVANFSNSLVNDLCREPQHEEPGITGQCNPDIALPVEAFGRAKVEIALRNPAVIVWPPENATNIPPAFFDEEPDPLPDYAVSGYPISVQFNSARLDSWSVSALRLYDVAAQAYVSATRFLDSASDPNGVLRENEFALFPLQRLEWGRQYRVELEYVIDGVPQIKVWYFATRDLGGEVKTIGDNDSMLHVANNATSYLYFTPADGFASLSAYRYVYPQTAQLEFTYVDHNTIALSVQGMPGDRIVLEFADGRVLTLVVDESGRV